MTDENKNKEDASKEIIENINKAVGEKLSQGFEDISRKLNSGLDEKINKLNFGKSEKEDDDQDFNYFGNDDDETVKKSDLEKIILKTKKDTIAEIKSEFKSQSAKQSKDTQALEHFPMLNPNSDTFNKDFTEQVKTEISRRIANGQSNESPELVYDAAALIENNWMKQGKFIPKGMAEKINIDGRSGSNFGKNFTPSSNGKAPNSRQIELASQFGVSVDSLKERLRSS